MKSYTDIGRSGLSQHMGGLKNLYVICEDLGIKIVAGSVKTSSLKTLINLHNSSIAQEDHKLRYNSRKDTVECDTLTETKSRTILYDNQDFTVEKNKSFNSFTSSCSCFNAILSSTSTFKIA